MTKRQLETFSVLSKKNWGLKHKAATIYLNIAFCYEKLGDYDSVEPLLQEALAYYPEPTIYLNLGSYYSTKWERAGGNRGGKMEDLKQAIQYCQNAHELLPLSPNPSYCLGLCYQGLGELEKAMLYLREASHLEPAGETGEKARKLLKTLETESR